MIDLDDLVLRCAGGLGVFVSTLGTALVGVLFSRLAALDAKIEKAKQEMFDSIGELREEYQAADDKLQDEVSGAHERLRLEFKADIGAMRAEITQSISRLTDTVTEHRVYVEKIVAGYATRQEIMSAFDDIKTRLR